MKKNSKYMYYSCLSSRLKVYIFILICACFMLFVLNKITGGILNIFTNFWQSTNDFLFFLALLILFSAGFFACGYSIFSCLMQMALYKRLEKNSKTITGKYLRIEQTGRNFYVICTSDQINGSPMTFKSHEYPSNVSYLIEKFKITEFKIDFDPLNIKKYVINTNKLDKKYYV